MEWNAVERNYTEVVIENHAKSMSLIGIWKNQTIQHIIKMLVDRELWTEEVAMERTIELARVNMKGAVEIRKIVIEHRDALKVEVSECEKKEVERWRTGKATIALQQKDKEELNEAKIRAFKQRWTMVTKQKKHQTRTGKGYGTSK